MRYFAPMRWSFTMMFVLAFAPMALAAGEGKVEAIAPTEAAQQMKDGKAVVIDVRERSELDAGMAEGAHWYPTSSIRSDPDGYAKFLASLPQDRTLVFYCASGARSGKAAEIASGAGRKAANLGGFKDWKGAGLPVTAPPKSL